MKTIWIMIALSAGAYLAPASEPTAQSVVLHQTVDHLVPSNANNLVTYAAPRAISVVDLGLKEAGMQAGPTLLQADELRIFENRSAMNASPKARLFLNSREGGGWWYHTGGKGAADRHVIQPGEAVVVITRVSTNTLAWRNPLAD